MSIQICKRLPPWPCYRATAITRITLIMAEPDVITDASAYASSSVPLTPCWGDKEVRTCHDFTDELEAA